MTAKRGLDRRTFLRGAGTTAVLGAVGARNGLAAGLADVAPRGNRDDFDFDEVYDRWGTEATKWDGAVQDTGAHIDVGMGIADLDFRAAPCIGEALAERCAHENWGYLRRTGSYKEAVIDWNRRHYGLEIEPDTLEFSTGVHPALISTLKTFSPAGTRVLLLTPTYNGFYTDLRQSKTIAEDCEMILEDGRYSIDWDAFERAAQRANTFILCNPQNPTGNVWSAEDLTRMGEICLRHRVVVLADEIHCDFVTAGQSYTPFASLDPEIVHNSLTYKAASKTFSIASMKVAWWFSTNPDLLERTKANSRSDLSTLGMVANRAALNEGDEWSRQCVEYIDGTHDLVDGYIRENIPLVKHVKPEGTFLAWLDVSRAMDRMDAAGQAAAHNARSASQQTADDVFIQWLAENAGVHLTAGAKFGTGGAGRARMNIGTSRVLVQKALDNMAEAMAAL